MLTTLVSTPLPPECGAGLLACSRLLAGLANAGQKPGGSPEGLPHNGIAGETHA